MNHCKVAAANEANPTWGKAHKDACHDRWVREHAVILAVLPLLERRERLAAMHPSLADQVRAVLTEMWSRR